MTFERYGQRTFSMDEFITAFAEGTGDSLGWWRRDWLERPGVPEIDVETRVRREGDRFITSVRLVQPSPARRLPLELEMGTERRRLWVSTPVVEARFIAPAPRDTATVAAPDTVTIDPRGWVPARPRITTAEVPTRWGDPFESPWSRR